MVDLNTIHTFQQLIWDFYKKNKRILPWREDITPYKIVVSEVMLQQTQVPRIINKFNSFIQELPDFQSLAKANLNQVLRLWSGIGYNRRAIYLQQIAKLVTNTYKGILPEQPDLIDSFPGIGPATAASIVVYAFNKPVPFIETNVRKIYIHHFFHDQESVSDNEIFPIVENTLDKKNPREWYYALMDYGTMLSNMVDNPNKRSKHYIKQSKFEGSDRQIRGGILKHLISKGPQTKESLFKLFTQEEGRVEKVITALEKEGFIVFDKTQHIRIQ